MSDKHWHATDDAERATWAPIVKTLRCLACRRAWLVSTERWRVYLTEGDDDTPSLTFPFCPACAITLFREP